MSVFVFSQYYFNRSSLVEKCEVTPHCLYRNSLTLIYHISSDKRRTLVAPLNSRIYESVPPKSAAPLQ